MTTSVWNGSAGNGTWNDANNWTRGGVAGASIPLATDDVYITTTNQDINGFSTGVSFNSITVGTGYKGTIGADGVPVTFVNCTTTFKYAGNGSARFATSGTVASCELAHTLGTFYWSGAGTLTLFTNTYGGFVIADATIVVTLQNVGGRGTAGPNATAITTVKNSGEFTCKRDVTTWYADAGKNIQQDNGTTTLTKCASIIVAGQAYYNKQSSGTETAIEVKPGGKFTLENCAGGSTGTVNLGTVTRWVGSSIKTSALPGVTVTVAYSAVGASAAQEAA